MVGYTGFQRKLVVRARLVAKFLRQWRRWVAYLRLRLSVMVGKVS
jgi:hypothetical protein